MLFRSPIFSINDYWTLSSKTKITTSAYASFGLGGGSGAIGSYDSKIVRNADGQLLFDPQVVINAASTTMNRLFRQSCIISVIDISS